MSYLDTLIRQYAAPELRLAGFRRSGRSFRRASDRGDVAFVAFAEFPLDPVTVTFGIELALTTRAHWEWIRRQTAPQYLGPPEHSGWLLRWSCPPPEQLARDPEDDPETWMFGPRTDEVGFGAQLAQALRTTAVPQLLHLLDRGNLLEECRTPRIARMKGLASPLERQIIAMVDDAPVEVVEEALRQRPEGEGHRDFAPWVRARLAGRE
ncbi:hypothetical protein AB0K43_26335 [Kitasatospora sp. NPDC049258]|uniref:hypothetical protein n=1 Tax=Kitasatospora sp. NPDC049258 TaxID=3155394 RepID=UPI003440FB62